MQKSDIFSVVFLCITNIIFMVAGIFLNSVVIISLWRLSQLRKKPCYFMILVLSCYFVVIPEPRAELIGRSPRPEYIHPGKGGVVGTWNTAVASTPSQVQSMYIIFTQSSLTTIEQIKAPYILQYDKVCHYYYHAVV
jgi:hypothetical protein